MRKKRLLWQLYFPCLLIALVALGAITWHATVSAHNFYYEQMADDLQSRALLLEGELRKPLSEADYAPIDASCKELGKKTSMRVTVILPDGQVVGDTDETPTHMDNHADRPEVIEALSAGLGQSRRYSSTLQEERMYVAIPVREAGKTLGALRVSVSLAAIQQTFARVGLPISLGGLLAAAVFSGATLWFSRRALLPLEQLKRGAEQFAKGDLSHRLPISDSLELGTLAETMNKMAMELDDKIRFIVRQRNEREAILASMVEGVLAVDADERLLRLNQTAARLMGVDSSRAEGRNLHEVVRNVKLQRLVADVLVSRQSQEIEIEIHDNGDRYLQAHGAAMQGAQAETIGVVVVLHDVTRLKRLEQVRRDFVANVSHELRTPVTSIKGFVETLLDGAMDDPDELRRFLRIVAVQTDRLNAIIEDLLTLSRIEQEAEKAEITLAPTFLKGVLETAIEVCAVKIREKKIVVELDCPADLEAEVNPPLLEQAVINLLDNAVKYSADGQTVRVSAVREGAEVAIAVRDQGCGISREHLPRIFERFYRVDKARSRKLGGTGLGLAIVKHIAQVHRGTAAVESVIGQGSTFSIRLPVSHGEN
jgi:two-component system, OmpR family, phosphate regulon sensor histidine kinase PhoR